MPVLDPQRLFAFWGPQESMDPAGSAKLLPVKLARLLVLLLVCVLLPFRGAVGATAHCAEQRPADGLVAMVAPASHGGHESAHPWVEDAVSGDAAESHADSDHPCHGGADQGAHGDRCHLCASSCHAAAMLNAWPAATPVMPVVSVVFPTLLARAPHFQSDGQDRPPRAL